MDDTDSDAHDALERAIAENPEEVAAFVERLGLVNDLLATTELATAALEDDMVISLAETGASLGELVDTAAEPDTVATLSALLTAVGDAGDEPPEPIGGLEALRAMRDPDVRRGLSFLLDVARMTGRELDRRESRP